MSTYDYGSPGSVSPDEMTETAAAEIESWVDDMPAEETPETSDVEVDDPVDAMLPDEMPEDLDVEVDGLDDEASDDDEAPDDGDDSDDDGASGSADEESTTLDISTEKMLTRTGPYIMMELLRIIWDLAKPGLSQRRSPDEISRRLAICRDYSFDEIGISRMFADWSKPRLRYVTERKCWYAYDGVAWKPNDAKAMEECKRFTRAIRISGLLFCELIRGNAEPEIKEFYQKMKRFFENLITRRVREIILKDAASVYPVSMNDFDKDSNLFNCVNGTLDIETGEFRSHRPEDLITKVAGVIYDPNARCPRWEQFIDEVMEDDQEKAVYLQKALGLGLLGGNPHECLFLLYGATSRNGKGTTMETYMTLMGDYGRAARPDTITQRQTPNGSGPSEDIARLAGARVVNISEPDKKMVLSSALVKTLTGNDTVTARFLHENSFEFRPAFKMMINTNYLPSVQDPTVFTSGRVKVIPFTRHFDGSQQDKGLKATLRRPENLSGILNWCLEGYQKLLDEGFDEPASVQEATAQYQQDSDKIARFIEECLKKSVGARTQTTAVYEVFKTWCTANGQMPEGMPKFKQALQAHIKVGRFRIPGCANAVSCVLDYIASPQAVAYQDDNEEERAYAPLSRDALAKALEPHGYRLGDNWGSTEQFRNVSNMNTANV